MNMRQDGVSIISATAADTFAPTASTTEAAANATTTTAATINKQLSHLFTGIYVFAFHLKCFKLSLTDNNGCSFRF